MKGKERKGKERKGKEEGEKEVKYFGSGEDIQDYGLYYIIIGGVLRKNFLNTFSRNPGVNMFSRNPGVKIRFQETLA